MNKLFKLFEEESLDGIVQDYPEIMNRQYIVWYPSCGYDYRHIADDALEGTHEDKIYLHSDVSALNGSYDDLSIQNPIFNRGDFKGNYSTRLVCRNYYELRLKNDLYFPCYDVLQDSFGKRIKNRGKVYCFIMTMKGDPDKLILLIYFGFENTNLFFDYIIQNSIKISELIHVNDGGQSFGCSNLKMDYIYPYLIELGIEKMKLDTDIETKFNRALVDFGSYKYSNPLNEKCGRVPRWVSKLGVHINMDKGRRDELLSDFNDRWEEKNIIGRINMNQKFEQAAGTNMYARFRDRNQFNYLYIKRNLMQYYRQPYNEISDLTELNLPERLEDILRDSCFYYSARADITPIVACKDFITSYVYCDINQLFSTIDGMSKLKKRMHEQNFNELQKMNINAKMLGLVREEYEGEYQLSEWFRADELAGEISIWEHNNRRYVLLYIVWDNTATWMNLYRKYKIRPRAICNFKYVNGVDFNYLGFEDYLKPDFWLGSPIKRSEYKHIDKVDYYGDSTGQQGVGFHKRIDK